MALLQPPAPAVAGKQDSRRCLNLKKMSYGAASRAPGLEPSMEAPYTKASGLVLLRAGPCKSHQRLS